MSLTVDEYMLHKVFRSEDRDRAERLVWKMGRCGLAVAPLPATETLPALPAPPSSLSISGAAGWAQADGGRHVAAGQAPHLEGQPPRQRRGLPPLVSSACSGLPVGDARAAGAGLQG